MFGMCRRMEKILMCISAFNVKVWREGMVWVECDSDIEEVT